MSVVEVSVDYGGRLLTLQTGKLAKQADASVLAKYGDTHVLVSVCSSKVLKEEQSFFPLTVDFQEKYYSAGRIPGGFFKREARPSDRATLSARLIDRPVRPLFPEDYLCDTFITATVLSVDGKNDPDLVASIAASAALHISDVPWAGPIAACRVGLVDGQMICNLPIIEQDKSQIELLVSGVRSGVIMVEGMAREVSEKQMMDAIDFAHQQMQAVLDLQDELRSKVGKPKRDYPRAPKDESLKTKMRKDLWPQFSDAFAVREKLSRYEALAKVGDGARAKFGVAEPKGKEDTTRNRLVGKYFEELKGVFARELTLDGGHRIDGRGYADIRAIQCETGLLPRVHGTGLFTRGETQVLSTVTLGTSDDEQKIDALTGAYQKTFLLHYNFPPFSVGEARPLRPPGRREVGHGFLAERALSYIIPDREKFPYTVRLVSEVLESNGSSSMATVCSGSMALMDAGVPIQKPVAGVAMGLIKEDAKYAILSDILGDEDHLGDMDFKVCGTAEGITGFQMDLKIGGVSREIMERALDQARDGRLFILGKMREAIAEARAEISPYAPRIFTIKIKPDKVREVIGPGGKVVRSIIQRTGVKIDIEDDGSIHIASVDETSARKAIELINHIVEEPEVGRIYEAKVTRLADFGAFVEIIPGTEGLCHISELDHYRVRRVEDVVKEGDIIKVKCLEVDPQGKIRLSRKALLPRGEGGAEAPRPGVERAATRDSREPREAREMTDVDERQQRTEREQEDSTRGDRGRMERPDRGGRDLDRDRGRGPESGAGRFEGGADRGGSRGFDRGGDRGPDRGGDRGPDRGGDRGPDRGGDRGPDRGGSRGPDRGGRFDRGGGGGGRPPHASSGGRGGPDRGPRDQPRPRNDRDEDRGNRVDARPGPGWSDRGEGHGGGRPDERGGRDSRGPRVGRGGGPGFDRPQRDEPEDRGNRVERDSGPPRFDRDDRSPRLDRGGELPDRGPRTQETQDRRFRRDDE